MSFVERVNQGESLASWLNWLNWLTEPPAVSWSVIMGGLSAIWKGGIWTHPNAFRTGPGTVLCTACVSDKRPMCWYNYWSRYLVMAGWRSIMKRIMPNFNDSSRHNNNYLLFLMYDVNISFPRKSCFIYVIFQGTLCMKANECISLLTI